MKFSRRKYDRLAALCIPLSMGLHLLLCLVPNSVKEWVAGPPQVPVYASRFEVVALERPPVPRYVSAEPDGPEPQDRAAVVPPELPFRVRAAAADSAVSLAVSGSGPPGPVSPEEAFFQGPPGEAFQQAPEDSSALVQAYISTVLDRVRDRRYYPEAARRLGQQGEVLLAFSIDRAGRLDGEVKLLGPCRYGLLNRSARRSVERSAPFPPLPGPVLDRTLPLKIRLLYRLTD